jgi:hypothetical protein
MGDPGPFPLTFLKINLTRGRPGEKRFADGGKVQGIDFRRQGDDPGLDFPPRFATAGHQAFSSNVAFEGFGRSCLRDGHEVKISDVTKKGDAILIALAMSSKVRLSFSQTF